MTWTELLPIILVVIIIVFILLTLKKNNKISGDQYDERQEMIRRKAYKYSAMTMVLLSVIYFLITTLLKKPFAEDGVSAFLIAMVGIAVFAVYSIFNDSFFGWNGTRGGIGRPLPYMILAAAIVIINGVGAVRKIREHELVRDGLLTSDVSNMALAILFLLVLITIIIRSALNAKEERGE